MKRKEHLAIVIAIFIATFMTSVEVTIVTTAMPTIISQLKGLELQSWVFAIYLLISAIATPIYGKLADNLGRKNIFIFGLVSFVIGSILCGIAPNMLFLIIFRAIQGIGAGAVMPLTFTIIADLFDFEERAKIMALNNTAWAISALVGPLLGGWIVDTLGWHWVFFINVPLGLITLLLTIFGYKDVHEKTAKQPMDWAGIASLSVLLVSLLLMFQEMSASTINWLLEVVLLFLIVAASIIFIRTEKKAVDPLFNLEMFKTRTFSIQIIISMLLSGCLIAFNIYFPIWLQAIYRVPAFVAGLALTPTSLFWMVTSFFVGFLLRRFARKRLYAVLVGILILVYIPLVISSVAFPIEGFYIISAFTGSVMGVILSTTTLLAQKMVPAEMVGQASSLVVLGRTLGQAMMTGILGLAFSLGINAGLSKFPEVTFKNVNEFISTASNAVVPEKIHGQLEQIVLGALHNVFFLALLLCVITFVVNLFDDGKLRA